MAPVTSDDAELERLALAADPDAPLPADAVPIGEVLGDARGFGGLVGTGGTGGGLLPAWYMGTPAARSGSRVRRAVVVLLVIACLAIPAAGLCITYGQLTLA